MINPTQTIEKVFISTDKIPTIQSVHSDERRDIREVIIPQVDGTILRVGEISIKNTASPDSPVVLGNHYHDTDEHFVLARGSAEVSTEEHHNPETAKREVLKAGDTITMKPGVAHAFTYTAPGVLRSTSRATFENAGMHSHKIV